MKSKPPVDGAFEAYRAERRRGGTGEVRSSAPVRRSTSTARSTPSRQTRSEPTAPRRPTGTGRSASGRSQSARRGTPVTARRPAQADVRRVRPQADFALPPTARSVNRRIAVMLGVMALVFGAVVVKLVDVQVLNPDRYVSQGERQRIVSSTIPAGRGSILDRNGIELALSLPAKTVFADPKLVLESGRAAEIATRLADILGLDRQVVLTKITGPGRFAVLAHTVGAQAANQIAKLKIPGEKRPLGIAMFDEFKPYFPSGDVARSLLGRVSTDGTEGISGLEKQFDSRLNGKAGSITYERRGRRVGADGRERGLTIAGGQQRVVPARPGSNVQLTIDRSMQYQTEQILADYVAAAGAKGGMAIITKPDTGEILSMANVAVTEGGKLGDASAVKPTSNNLALTTVFEPGSVTKVVTISAAIDAGLIEPDTPMEVPDHLQIYDHEFTDHDPHPTVTWTPTDILVSSSNIGTIKIAQKLGRDRLDRAMRRFGLGSKSGLGFPNESAGLMLAPANWSGTSIGAIPIGQGIAVTALQMLSAFNVVANDGVAVAPRLVSATIGTDGRRTTEPPSTRHRVISVDTATKLRAMMAGVVTDGTGKKAAIPGYSVAGKTGTAYKALTEHAVGDAYLDTSGNHHYVATFAGFVPAEKPELSVIVVLDEPTRAVYAGDVSAPAFSEIARYALRRYRIPPAVVGGHSNVPRVADSAAGLGENRVPQSPTDQPDPIQSAKTGKADGASGSGPVPAGRN